MKNAIVLTVLSMMSASLFAAELNAGNLFFSAYMMMTYGDDHRFFALPKNLVFSETNDFEAESEITADSIRGNFQKLSELALAKTTDALSNWDVAADLNIKASAVWESILNCNPSRSANMAKTSYRDHRVCRSAAHELEDLRREIRSFFMSTQFKDVDAPTGAVAPLHPLFTQIVLEQVVDVYPPASIFPVAPGSGIAEVVESRKSTFRKRFEQEEKMFFVASQLSGDSLKGYIEKLDSKESQIIVQLNALLFLDSLKNFITLCSVWGLWPQASYGLLYGTVTSSSQMSGIAFDGHTAYDKISQSCSHLPLTDVQSIQYIGPWEDLVSQYQ